MPRLSFICETRYTNRYSRVSGVGKRVFFRVFDLLAVIRLKSNCVNEWWALLLRSYADRGEKRDGWKGSVLIVFFTRLTTQSGYF